MKFDKIISGAHLTLSIIYLGGVYTLPLGTLKGPGAGLFPLIIGVLWLVSSIVACINPKEITNDKLDAETAARVCKVGLAILGYLVLLPVIGFVLSTFIVLAYTTHLLGNKNKKNQLFFSSLGVVTFVLIFQYILQLPLPEPLLTLLEF